MRLGHNKLYDLIEDMQSHVRLRQSASKATSIEARPTTSGRLPLPAQTAENYITCMKDPLAFDNSFWLVLARF